MKIGLDIGSTTLKCVVVDDAGTILFRSYQRHFSLITQKTEELLTEIKETLPGAAEAPVVISGSAGMGLADDMGIPFVQEVYATRIAAGRLAPDTDVVIELGGEDAKILFLSGGMEVRMNGSCAGGTGAFIDQMATLLGVTPDEMDNLAAKAQKRYTIASRCGVFAKSDVQPLLNQGAKKEDVASSIFYAVVNQTIAGLAQGRKIEGGVLYLGGPLTFFPQLRASFDQTLHTTGLCPEDSLYFVALGAAFSPEEDATLSQVLDRLSHYENRQRYAALPPLFQDRAEYDAFVRRHQGDAAPRADAETYKGPAYLGIDAGSTTVKAALVTPAGELLFTRYEASSGNPVPLVREMLLHLRRTYPDIDIRASAVTGYGEDMIKSAFGVDFGLVETMAHFAAAKAFLPDVEFIIDIGGQDMKCFKIRGGAVDNIFLNEACSSGCGSFLQTFAQALGYSVEEFARLGLLAQHPVDLGSRCTVFMNSSVKQAQKDGASVEDISAGLAISVVKNALYKVIRASSPDELGRRIVVQGGTFLNDAVLRAFEMEMGVQVKRPDIAGLMGAYGAALYARDHSRAAGGGLLPLEALEQFTHEVRTTRCGLCGNHCQLTVNNFGGGRRYISGNRCQRPLGKGADDQSLNLYEYKRELLSHYKPVRGPRGVIGIPMALSMLELLPFWHAFFTSLGFEVVTSPSSSQELYLRGQATIPSDTVCYPAKLVHGHIQSLIDQGVDVIFYPCMTYNLNEQMGDNHYNCPVVAYYPEVITANMPDAARVTMITDYIAPHDKKEFPAKMQAVLRPHFGKISQRDIRHAMDRAYEEYDRWFRRVRTRGEEIVAEARRRGMPILVLAGRPYHVDREISHEVDRLITEMGVAVITEDSVSDQVEKVPLGVLNQWTYHNRLYAAARYIADQPDINLVQLVSFGCGVDAITTDEVREILESEGKIYTQIKIDEITNLGAVRIRLRSLLAAAEERAEPAREEVPV